ncbi:caspase family protein [Nocardia sp. CA-290969]|uniref:caspase family protein n=1 Tax=Nocardia sp. CA-290969 TaxID=3239986 RepID=UPI003D89FD45
MLIGVGQYRHGELLPAIPAVAGNLQDLHRFLTHGSFATEHCVLVSEPRRCEDIGTPLRAAAAAATDVLLVYYAGHGLLDERNQFHLGLADTHPEMISWSALPFDLLRAEILDSPAKIRILILDCCFAGRVFEAMSFPANVVIGQTDIKGTYTIVSSGANETAAAPRGHRNTAFTAALLATAAATPGATLDELYRDIDRYLLAQRLPRPQRRAIDVAGDLVLFEQAGPYLGPPGRQVPIHGGATRTLSSARPMKTAASIGSVIVLLGIALFALIVPELRRAEADATSAASGPSATATAGPPVGSTEPLETSDSWHKTHDASPFTFIPDIPGIDAYFDLDRPARIPLARSGIDLYYDYSLGTHRLTNTFGSPPIGLRATPPDSPEACVEATEVTGTNEIEIGESSPDTVGICVVTDAGNVAYLHLLESLHPEPRLETELTLWTRR